MEDYSMGQRQEKILLIDTDAGIDDAWALLMALRAQSQVTQLTSPYPKVTIAAITTVCGNTTLEHVANNVTRTLDTVNDKTVWIN